jgi:hypothetical protein
VLFDPATGDWLPTGSAASKHEWATATLLNDGRVLVAGGGVLTTEIYDPSTGNWLTQGNLGQARASHTATRLLDGRVLVTGGVTGSTVVPTAELYNPATGTWAPTGSLNQARAYHAAALLPNGKVLVVGGSSTADGLGSLASAELYDPASGTWSPAASMSMARAALSATALPNGHVVAVGGNNGNAYRRVPSSTTQPRARGRSPAPRARHATTTPPHCWPMAGCWWWAARTSPITTCRPWSSTTPAPARGQPPAT